MTGLFPIPDTWTWTTLGEIAEVVGGVTKDSKKQNDPSYPLVPYLRVANVQRGYLDLEKITEIRVPEHTVEKLRLQSGDVLLNEGGDRDKLGRGWVWNGEIPDCIHQNHVFRARIIAGVLEPKLLAWYVNESARHWFEVNATQSVNLASISKSTIQRLPVPVPPLAEQRRIVATLEDHLGRLDSANSGVARTGMRLKMLQKRLLVEAVPIPGPDHWRVAPVAEAGRVELGRARHPDWHAGPNMRPYLRVANVFEDRIDASDLMEMHFPPEVFERYRLMKNDILLNEGQSPEYLGRPAIYQGEPPNVAFTNSLLRFRAGVDVLPEWALLVFRRHMHAGRFLREVRITTNIAHLSATRLKRVEFPIPPLDEQKRIVTEIREKFDAVRRFAGAVDSGMLRSRSLRKSLLAEAFAGRLVEQDSTDEPASVLLERLRAEQAAQGPVRRARRSKSKTAPQEETLV